MSFLPPIVPLICFPALVAESEGESSGSEEIVPVKKAKPKKFTMEEVSDVEEAEGKNEASNAEDDDEDEDDEEEVLVHIKISSMNVLMDMLQISGRKNPRACLGLS